MTMPLKLGGRGADVVTEGPHQHDVSASAGAGQGNTQGLCDMTSTVEPQDLRVGMFIHLDGGWMSHPFPLSSFKISSAEQIDTIRSLGLRKVERQDAVPALSLDSVGLDSDRQ